MKPKVLTVTLCAWASVIALSVGSLRAQVMNPIKFEEYDLPNGLHVILYPDHSSPVVATRVYYHVGSKNETPERTGFAHFFEHLMFEATDNIKRGEFSKNVEQVGGNLNAYTSFDQTVYINNIPSNQLQMALWAEAERMHWLHVDSIGVETQRSVVKEERRNRYENQPYGSFVLKLMENVFKGTKYEWTAIGSAQYIDQATIAEFQDFYRRYYVPNNAVLVVAGDFNAAETKKWVNDYFATIPAGQPIDRPQFNMPPQNGERVSEISEQMTPLPGVIYAWRTVKEGERDAYALDLLTKVLAQGNSSRLRKRLVEDEQVAVEVETIPWTLEQTGVFAVLAIAKAGTAPEVIRNVFDEELRKIKDNGITAEEYEKVRNQITKDLVTEAASVEAIAVKLAHMHTMFGNTNRVNEELGHYLAVTRDDIKRVAAQYLTDANRSVMIYTVPNP